MAMSTLIKSQLRLVFENGINPETSKVILKTKSYNNIKVNATADQLFGVANALASLQQLPLYTIERNDQSEIVDA